jgi:predicted ATPase
METIQITEKYGPLQENLSVSLPDGYCVIIGENDVGKTAILQRIFISLFQTSEIPRDSICFIPKNRDTIVSNSSTAGQTLERINVEIYNCFNTNKMSHEDFLQCYRSLFPVLMQEHGFRKQTSDTADVLSEMGLGNYDTGKGGINTVNDVSISQHGSGVRSLMGIVAAINCPSIKHIIIDEPEVSLEAGKQKMLKSLIVEACKEGKNIIIATHSHLFLNSDVITSNFRVMKKDNAVSIVRLERKEELSSVAFKMLGNSLSDLYLPDNYLLVEGSSDQVIVEKVLEILSDSTREIRVITCGGIQNVRPTKQSMDNVFKPIIEGKSPYAPIAVALVDYPREDDTGAEKIVSELKRFLGPSGRFFLLTQPSIEEYFPESIYTKFGIDRTARLGEIEAEKDYRKVALLKEALAKDISDKLAPEDLEKIPIIVDAVRRALAV